MRDHSITQEQPIARGFPESGKEIDNGHTAGTADFNDTPLRGAKGRVWIQLEMEGPGIKFEAPWSELKLHRKYDKYQWDPEAPTQGDQLIENSYA